MVLSWEPANWLWGANWNFTAYTYWEIATKNTFTDYQSAPLFHVDFTATATWGKWTIGSVADYWTQVGHDTSSPFYANTANGTCGINAAIGQPPGFECLGPQNLWAWAVGGLLQYNFGPVTLQLWATDIVAAHASNQSLTSAGLDPAATNSGYTVWFQASYALWTPPAAQEAPKSPLIYK